MGDDKFSSISIRHAYFLYCLNIHANIIRRIDWDLRIDKLLVKDFIQSSNAKKNVKLKFKKSEAPRTDDHII